MPHFGFAAAARGVFVSRGVGIIRVDLDGELIGGENKFHEERETRRSGVNCVPRHSTGISRQASPSVLPANGRNGPQRFGNRGR